jgi:hypothetical protein
MPTSSAFNGSILLGAPSANSVKLKLLSADQKGTVSISYGPTSSSSVQKTSTFSLLPGEPLELTLSGLDADTPFTYKLQFAADGTSATESGPYTFVTARGSDRSFTFTVQADSHLDENSDLDQYRRTLSNVLADKPDFHLDLGDTFMTEKHSDPFTALVQMAADLVTVKRRYAYERANFGAISHSVPLYLVNGNHDGELGWLLNGTTQNLAIWATQARPQFFMNPSPGTFYSGDSGADRFSGLLVCLDLGSRPVHRARPLLEQLSPSQQRRLEPHAGGAAIPMVGLDLGQQHSTVQVRIHPQPGGWLGRPNARGHRSRTVL